MTMNWVQITLVLLCFEIAGFARAGNYCITKGKIECYSKDKNISFSCQYNIANGRPWVSIDLEISKRVSTVFAHIEWSSEIGKRRVTVMNTTIDFCMLLNGRSFSNALGYSVDFIRQWGYMPRDCPIEPGKYYVRNYTENWEKTPFAMSGGSRIKLIFYDKVHNVLRPKVYLDLDVSWEVKRRKEKCISN